MGRSRQQPQHLPPIPRRRNQQRPPLSNSQFNQRWGNQAAQEQTQERVQPQTEMPRDNVRIEQPIFASMGGEQENETANTTPAAGGAVATQAINQVLDDAEIQEAIGFNDGLNLGLDYLRQLQAHLNFDISAISSGGGYTASAVLAIANHQVSANLGDPDGKLGPNTRGSLQPHLNRINVATLPAIQSADDRDYEIQTVTPAARTPGDVLDADALADAIAWNQSRGAANETQLRLIQQHLGVAQTGSYDTATVQAFARFQREHFLTEDGKLGTNGFSQLRRVIPALIAEPEGAVTDPATWDADTLAEKVSRNNSIELRVDWVRNLQTALGVAQDPQGRFTSETVVALGRFERDHRITVDGFVDGDTRATLEANFEALRNNLLGEHLEPRVLVPAGASSQARYEYYKRVIEDAGGAFSTENGEVNMLGIRGVLISGSDGALELYQTDSAEEYAELVEQGGPSNANTHSAHHFFADRQRDVRLDDVLINIWVDKDESGRITGYHASERQGTVDPGSHNNHPPTGHLRDGQYVYGVGTHGTGSSNHQSMARSVARSSNAVSYSNGRYTALRSQRDVEVNRDLNRDGFISPAELANSNTRVGNRQTEYVEQDYIAMNIHMSSNTTPFSQGCQNIRQEDYAAFMEEMTGATNSRELYYTLIDASKIGAVVSVTE